MKLQKLTKAEEEVMMMIWELGPCTVSHIIKHLSGPKPPHSTISSIVRILEKKGFLSHKAYGRTYEYHPIIKEETYSKYSVRNVMSNYFKGSANELVSFLLKNEEVDISEIKSIIDQIENE